MNDIINRTRPTENNLRAEWTPPARIVPHLEGARPMVLPTSRRRLLIGASGVAAALVIGTMAALPQLRPQQAAVPQAAPSASATSESQPDRWADGQFLHVRTESVQTNDDGESTIVRDDYVASDGWTWSVRRGTDPIGPIVDDFIFAPGSGWTNMDYAATLPTDAAQLDVFLRERVTGSSSQDAAVFVAVGDMLRAPAAPRAVRAAAVGVLELNPSVTTSDGTAPDGRAALVATLAQISPNTTTRTMYLDPVTRDVIAEQTVLTPPNVPIWGDSEGNERPMKGSTYTALITSREILDALPAEVVAKLGSDKIIKDGNETPSQYTNLPDPQPRTEPDPNWNPTQPTR